MRLFLAIELPDKIKDQIDLGLTEIKKQYQDYRWVPKEKYHITIEFFGETEKFEMIKKTITDLIYDQPSFYLYSTDVDLFINKNIKMFLNFRREKKLETLSEIIKQKFNIEVKNNIKFIPRLTIGRTRISSKQQYFVLKKRLKEIMVNVEFPVKKIILFDSISTGTPIFKKVAQFPLIKAE